MIETTRGFYLLHVLERQAEVTRKLEDVRGQIASKVASDRRAKEYDARLEQLRKSAVIRIDDAELNKVSIGVMPGAGG